MPNQWKIVLRRAFAHNFGSTKKLTADILLILRIQEAKDVKSMMKLKNNISPHREDMQG